MDTDSKSKFTKFEIRKPDQSIKHPDYLTYSLKSADENVAKLILKNNNICDEFDLR